MAMKDEYAEDLVRALESLVRGGHEGPTGFEAVTMSIAGPRVGDDVVPDSLCAAIREGLHEIAEAIANLGGP